MGTSHDSAGTTMEVQDAFHSQGLYPRWEDRFHSAARSLQLQHHKSNPDTERNPRQWFCSSLLQPQGEALLLLCHQLLSPFPLCPHDSANMTGAGTTAGVMHTIHEGTTPHTNIPSLSPGCKVRIFYFPWPISLFPLEALHFLGRVGMFFVPLEEERRLNGFKVMTVIKK